MRISGWQASRSMASGLPREAGGVRGRGSLNGVSLDGLADVMNDEWIAGTASGTYAVKGTCTPEFWTSGEGTLRFAMKDGRLPHVALSEDAGTFKVTEFSGQARLHAGEIEMKDASLESPDGKFRLSGTAPLAGRVGFQASANSEWRRGVGIHDYWHAGGTAR